MSRSTDLSTVFAKRVIALNSRDGLFLKRTTMSSNTLATNTHRSISWANKTLESSIGRKLHSQELDMKAVRLLSIVVLIGLSQLVTKPVIALGPPFAFFEVSTERYGLSWGAWNPETAL